MGDWNDKLLALCKRVPRSIRRPVVIGVGSLVLLAGFAMLVLPGPAFIVIPLALAILSPEVPFARRVLVLSRRALKPTWNRLKRAWNKLRGARSDPEPEAPEAPSRHHA